MSSLGYHLGTSYWNRIAESTRSLDYINHMDGNCETSYRETHDVFQLIRTALAG